MNVRIKKLILENFKGTDKKTYVFGNIVRILGANGKGKTTIMTAWYWLMADKDSSLNSNPNIRPNDNRECVPQVTAILDIDGTEVTIAKMQKMKKSKPDDNGQVKVTLANSYEVNSVPLTERDFKTRLQEYGIDFDTFLVCSHTDVFVGQKAKDMRAKLFEMATTKSDQEIAEMDITTKDVAEMLKSYKFSEIEAMQKASKKKAQEEIDSIPNQIIGMEKSKTDIDTAEQELAKAELERQIAELDKQIGSPNTEIGELQTENMNLQFDISGIMQKMNANLSSKRLNLKMKISELESNIKSYQFDISNSEMTLKTNDENITLAESQRKQLGEQYKAELVKEFDNTPYIFDESKWVFDESSTVCSMCGQTLPKDKITALKANFEDKKQSAMDNAKHKEDEARTQFEKDKKQTLDRIVKEGFQKKDAIDLLNDASRRIGILMRMKQTDLEKAQAELTELEKQLSELPAEADYLTSEEYVSKKARLAEIEQKISSFDNSTMAAESLKNEQNRLYAELDNVKAVIAQASNNVRIDEQIDELRASQLDYEQKKADAERILYQLSLVSKKKNELLVDDINRHFKVVKFQLFDYLKNGEYKEVCIPMIDGFRFGESTNTGREILAKLDICNGFQNFYGTHYPIFLDSAESLNKCNVPKMDCQLISLIVTDDSELKIESNVGE